MIDRFNEQYAAIKNKTLDHINGIKHEKFVLSHIQCNHPIIWACVQLAVEKLCV